jgi:hypothetical protein
MVLSFGLGELGGVSAIMTISIGYSFDASDKGRRVHG